MDKQGQRETKG
jgi:hypothetical protein